MKRLSLILVTALLGSAGLFAAPGEVAVLYNGATPTNIDALHFFSKELASDGGYRVVGVDNPTAINPGAYRAIVVLSTGLTSGVDRKLSDFIASWEAKSRIILVSLRKGSKDLTVAQYPPAPENLGVDAVTAASAWTGKGLAAIFGGKKSAEYQMHVDWVGRVRSLIYKLQ